MSFTTHRVESCRVELLSRDEFSLFDLEGFTGGSLQWNANATLPGGGTINLKEVGQEINYSSDRVRVWWKVEGEPEWPLGVFVLVAPLTQVRADGRSRAVTLVDKLVVVRDDRILSTVQVPSGANVVAAAAAQLALTGETRVAVTDSSATLTNPMSWEAGTSRLQVINDLLAVVGYRGLWTDRNGQFRIEPYTLPADRPVSWEFVEGDAAIHSPDWTHEIPLWEATNTVVMVSQATDDDVVWTAYAVDDNPDSPTSTVSMGRVLNPIVEENVEALSQLDLQLQANRKLIDNSNVAGRLSVSHAMVPLWYNDAVHFESQGFSGNAVVVQMKVDLSPGAQVQAEWRQA